MKKKLLNDIDPAFVEEINKLKTLKEIIEYGTRKGGDKRQFIFLNAKKEEEERSFNQTWDEITALGTTDLTAKRRLPSSPRIPMNG